MPPLTPRPTTRRVHWQKERNRQGYYVTRDGRWLAQEYKAKGQPPAITLTDSTRRARFVDTDASWIRLPTWEAVRAMILAHG